MVRTVRGSYGGVDTGNRGVMCRGASSTFPNPRCHCSFNLGWTAPSQSSGSNGISTSAKLGVGLGIGLGVPLAALTAFLLFRWRKAAGRDLPIPEVVEPSS